MHVTPRPRAAIVALVTPLALSATLGRPRVARAQYQEVDACIEANEQAVARKKAGRLIDERAALSRCAASPCPDAVRTSCRERLAAVSRAIPTLVVAAKDREGRDLTAVRVTIDGRPYADRLDGSAIALDPGEHELRFEAAGAPPVAQRFVLRENEQDRHETIVIDEPRGESGSATRALAWTLGGAGVASLAAGGVVGALSLAAHGDYQRHCGANIGAPDGACDAQGVAGERDAATKGNVATALLVGGTIALAAGTALYLWAPHGAHGVRVGVVPLGFVLGGEL